ncbi:unnamed protein product [Didymodactylos carnosus]|uniref:Uncharacterized protein n=1 Tax=Didymodactylos carnosus TaxID=1234261 RepID=A0A8S2DZF2_9BILA|nr:unnamed protein product [Didymodactylos carnosus]CAF3836377.1 unnamed protein product [Didymodactylos carnosus]
MSFPASVSHNQDQEMQVPSAENDQQQSVTTTVSSNTTSDDTEAFGYFLQAIQKQQQKLAWLQDKVVELLTDETTGQEHIHRASATLAETNDCFNEEYKQSSTDLNSKSQQSPSFVDNPPRSSRSTLKRPHCAESTSILLSSVKKVRPTITPRKTTSLNRDIINNEVHSSSSIQCDFEQPSTTTTEKSSSSLKCEPRSSVSDTTSTKPPSATADIASLSCSYLGTLSSRNRDVLSQVCLQIAHQSKLKFHFIQRKDVEKMKLIGLNLSNQNQKSFTKPSTTNQSDKQNENSTLKRSTDRLKIESQNKTPVEIKVLFKRQQLEQINEETERFTDCEPITVSGSSLIDFLIGNCNFGLFRTTEKQSVGKEIIGNAICQRSALPSSHYRFWRKRIKKYKYQGRQLVYQVQRCGLILTKHQSPITSLKFYRGILYSCSLNGSVRFHFTQSLRSCLNHKPIVTPNGGTQSLQLVHSDRFNRTVICVAGFDQILRVYSMSRDHQLKGQIFVGAPVHCTTVKFKILFAGLGSGEVAFISTRRLCVIHTIKCSAYVISSVSAAFDPDKRRLLMASSVDGSIIVISLVNEERRLVLEGKIMIILVQSLILKLSFI